MIHPDWEKATAIGKFAHLYPNLRGAQEKFYLYLLILRKPLYLCYIDNQKVFDTVWQEGLWAAMRHLGFPDKIVRLLQALYQISTSAVRVDDDITEWFIVCFTDPFSLSFSPQLSPCFQPQNQ